MKAKMIVAGELASFCVGDAHRRLKPARHCVGKIRNQLACRYSDDDPLPLARAESETIHTAGCNLAVHDSGKRNAFGLRSVCLRRTPEPFEEAVKIGIGHFSWWTRKL